MKMLNFLVAVTMLSFSCAVLAEQPASPAHCQAYRDALNRLDLSGDPYFNKVHNSDVGESECLVEIESLPLDEVKKELAVAMEVQKTGCGGRDYENVYPPTAPCEIANVYVTLIQNDLDQRATSPICHEYYRSRDNDHLTEEQNARQQQLCDKEMAEQTAAFRGEPLKNLHGEIQGVTINNLVPHCPGLTADECSKGLVKELTDVGCQSVSLSCNANKTYCIFGTSNCAAPFESYGGLHKCDYTDVIVHLGTDNKNFFPAEFLCRW